MPPDGRLAVRTAKGKTGAERQSYYVTARHNKILRRSVRTKQGGLFVIFLEPQRVSLCSRVTQSLPGFKTHGLPVRPCRAPAGRDGHGNAFAVWIGPFMPNLAVGSNGDSFAVDARRPGVGERLRAGINSPEIPSTARSPWRVLVINSDDCRRSGR